MPQMNLNAIVKPMGPVLALLALASTPATAQTVKKSTPAKSPLIVPMPEGRVVAAQDIGLDQRLVVFPYDPNAIYPVLVQVEQFTVFRLGTRTDNEQIAGAYLGKTTLWSVEGTPDKKELRIKPNLPGIKDTLQIRTNLRDYFIDLVETSNKPKSNWYQRVSWDVPRPSYEDLTVNTAVTAGGAVSNGNGTNSANAQGQGSATSGNGVDNNGGMGGSFGDNGECRGLMVDVSRVDQQYEVKGNAPFAPKSPVFDNGTHTFVRLPPNVQEVPAIFALAKNGEAELVNHRYVCGLYKIDRVVDYGLLLKLGSQEVTIVKKTADCGWFGWNCSSKNYNISN
jgi:type IV secretion system protein TrbG